MQSDQRSVDGCLSLSPLQSVSWGEHRVLPSMIAVSSIPVRSIHYSILHATLSRRISCNGGALGNHHFTPLSRRPWHDSIIMDPHPWPWASKHISESWQATLSLSRVPLSIQQTLRNVVSAPKWQTRLNNIIDAAYAVVPLPFHDSFIVGKLAGYLGQSFIFTPASDTNIHSSSSLKLAYIVGVRLHHESEHVAEVSNQNRTRWYPLPDLEISIMAYVLIWWQRRAFPDLLFR